MKRCTIGPTSAADAAAMLVEAKERFLQMRLRAMNGVLEMLDGVRKHALQNFSLEKKQEIDLCANRRKFLGIVASAALVLTPGAVEAWFPHGGGGGVAPPSPQWPAAGPGTNYYVADPSVGGSDSTNNGLSTSTPWATLNKVSTFAGYGSGVVTINVLSTFSYLCPSSGSFTAPTSPSTVLIQGLVGATIPPVIKANGGGFIGILKTTGTNQTFQGLQTAGDGGANNMGVHLTGSNNSVLFCRIALATTAADSIGFSFQVGGTGMLIDHCVMGGISKTSSETCGVIVQSYNCKVTNNVMQFYGGAMGDNPTQSGFGVHIDGAIDGGAVNTPFTYVAGVPTNALCEIAFNIIHDCGWNLPNNGGAGGNSGSETGEGYRCWIHDNIVYNILAGPGGGGTDYDPIDAADGGATFALVERNFMYNCFGGLIDFCSTNDPNWGPCIVRYNLAVNCGFQGLNAGIGNAALQGLSNNGIHQWYCNTFVLCAASTAMPGSLKNMVFFSVSTAQGFFVNNIVVAIYPWAIALFNDTPAALVNNKNCWFGVGNGFDFRPAGGGLYSTYAAAKAAQSTFDQNGVTGGPLFAQGISSTSWSGGLVTVTTTVPHGQVGTFVGTIDGNNWYNGASPTAMNGIFNMTVTGANTFTFPLASNPTTGGFPASTGVWSVGSVSAMLQASSWKLGSSSSSCYRTGVNVATTFGVSAGSTDLFGNAINPATASIGCHQP